MVTKYKKWISSQDSDFIKEVHGENELPDYFKDHNPKDITLEELRELDDRFINNARSAEVEDE